MKKKWKRYKNRIMALGMALSISCSSVFLPSVEVMASSTDSEVDDLIENGVFFDKNGDNKFTIDEVNPYNLIISCFSQMGYWVDLGVKTIIEQCDLYKTWCATGIDTIVAELDSANCPILTDNTVEFLNSLKNYIVSVDGYKFYPSMSTEALYYIENSSSSESSYVNGFMNAWTVNAEIGALVTKKFGYYYIYCPEWSSTLGKYSQDNVGNYVYVKYNNSPAYITIYQFDDNGVLQPVDSYGSRYYLSPIAGASGYYWDSYSGSSQFLSIGSDLVGFVGLMAPVFDSVTDAYHYYNLERNGFFGVVIDSKIRLGLDDYNKVDWETLNNKGYADIKDYLTSNGLKNETEVQEYINTYTQEVLSNLEFIEGENVQQTHFLKGIYELLKEWFPKLASGSSGGVEADPEFDSSVEDFEEDSNGQSEQLGQLVEDSKVEKPDIDSVSGSVDSNIDMESVGQYGVLLSSVTTNPRVVQLILISLSVSLIAYVFFGKR